MDELKIYIDRLKNDEPFHLEKSLPPTLLDVDEKELQFHSEVSVKVDAYLASDHLVLHFASIETKASLPCSICNKLTGIPLVVKDLYITRPLTEIKGATINLSDEIRESLLLQLPAFTECNQGKCLERAHVKKFITTEPSEDPSPPTHFPFANLD